MDSATPWSRPIIFGLGVLAAAMAGRIGYLNFVPVPGEERATAASPLVPEKKQDADKSQQFDPNALAKAMQPVTQTLANLAKLIPDKEAQKQEIQQAAGKLLADEQAKQTDIKDAVQGVNTSLKLEWDALKSAQNALVKSRTKELEDLGKEVQKKREFNSDAEKRIRELVDQRRKVNEAIIGSVIANYQARKLELVSVGQTTSLTDQLKEEDELGKWVSRQRNKLDAELRTYEGSLRSHEGIIEMLFKFIK